MNERLVIKSFGPIRSIDINFRKVNLFIGDQVQERVALLSCTLLLDGSKRHY